MRHLHRESVWVVFTRRVFIDQLGGEIGVDTCVRVYVHVMSQTYIIQHMCDACRVLPHVLLT